MSDLLSGQDLVHQLRTAALACSKPIVDFVRPLSSNPHKYLRQLNLAEHPTRSTIARVSALIEGRDVPAPRCNPAKGEAGVRPTSAAIRIDLDQRRAIAEAAAERRHPGETLHAAVRRIEAELLCA